MAESLGRTSSATPVHRFQRAPRTGTGSAHEVLLRSLERDAVQCDGLNQDQRSSHGASSVSRSASDSARGPPWNSCHRDASHAAVYSTSNARISTYMNVTEL